MSEKILEADIVKDIENLNEKFKNLELINKYFYEQIEHKGIEISKSTLINIFPDGSNTYSGKIIDQNDTLYFFDLDMDNKDYSIWNKIEGKELEKNHQLTRVIAAFKIHHSELT